MYTRRVQIAKIFHVFLYSHHHKAQVKTVFIFLFVYLIIICWISKLANEIICFVNRLLNSVFALKLLYVNHYVNKVNLGLSFFKICNIFKSIEIAVMLCQSWISLSIALISSIYFTFSMTKQRSLDSRSTWAKYLSFVEVVPGHYLGQTMDIWRPDI